MSFSEPVFLIDNPLSSLLKTDRCNPEACYTLGRVIPIRQRSYQRNRFSRGRNDGHDGDHVNDVVRGRCKTPSD